MGLNISQKVNTDNIVFKNSKKQYIVIFKKENDYRIITLKDKISTLDSYKIPRSIKGGPILFEGFAQETFLNKYVSHKSIKGSYYLSQKDALKILNK